VPSSSISKVPVNAHNAYGKDPDRLGDKLGAFTEERGLVAPFQRSAELGASPNGGSAGAFGNSDTGGEPLSVS